MSEGLIAEAMEIVDRAVARAHGKYPWMQEADFEDAAQEARIVVMRRLPKFDPSAGFELSTFLWWAIQARSWSTSAGSPATGMPPR